jgi:LDH2 family malate/lactate/ureidoglycolate dehydrogenase
MRNHDNNCRQEASALHAAGAVQAGRFLELHPESGLPPLIGVEDLTAFAVKLLTAAGADEMQASNVAEVLVWADTVGRPNQGVWRLPILCKRLSAGLFHCPCHPRIHDRAPTAALIDGDDGIGHFVGRFAVEAAVQRAAKHGIAIVAVANSNFLGPLGYYVERIARRDMLGMLFSNSFPKVAPHGGRKPVLGTNPLAFAAPRRNGQAIIVDLATAASAGSDITKAAELGQPLAVGIAIDRQGRPITDPSKVNEGALLPLGGAKGYALGLVVEILAGVATGAGISHGVRSMYSDFENPGNSGHLLVAIDINTLMPLDTFYDRMEFLIAAIRDCEGVLLPGETRWHARAETEAAGGIRLDEQSIRALTKLAKSLDVPPPWQKV